MKWRIADFFVIGIVFILAACIWVYPMFSQSGEIALIEQNGIVQTVSLQDDAEITLENATVLIENGEVYISEATCPDKVCVNTGRISKKGQSIVCVPNRIVVTIEGKSEIDAIAN